MAFDFSDRQNMLYDRGVLRCRSEVENETWLCAFRQAIRRACGRSAPQPTPENGKNLATSADFCKQPSTTARAVGDRRRRAARFFVEWIYELATSDRRSPRVLCLALLSLLND